MPVTNKRVRISYTVEMEEIPVRIADLLREAYGETTALMEQLEYTASRLEPNGDTNRAINALDQIRRGMMKVDLRLEDCQNLLVGYQSAHTQFNQANLEETQTVEEPITEEAHDD